MHNARCTLADNHGNAKWTDVGVLELVRFGFKSVVATAMLTLLIGGPIAAVLSWLLWLKH